MQVVQDIVCVLSPLQRRLYEDFQASQASLDVAGALRAEAGGSQEAGGGGGGAPHVFKALQYMRKLCSHPALVLDWTVPEHRQAVLECLGVEDVRLMESALRDVAVAPKLEALRELLVNCGLATVAGEAGEGGAEEEETGAPGHRVLIFAQLKAMLDLVERDVLQPAGVTYLRLDGSLEAGARFGVVQRFNADPTIDVLLLTTQVGKQGTHLSPHTRTHAHTHTHTHAHLSPHTYTHLPPPTHAHFHHPPTHLSPPTHARMCRCAHAASGIVVLVAVAQCTAPHRTSCHLT